ncbi:MAG: cytochrome c oxidase subunit II [Candidatus Kariarchaeaceae archaeon]
MKGINKIRMIVYLLGLVVTIPVTYTSAAPSESTYTPQVQLLLTLVILVSVMIASIVFGLLIYIAIRFREGSNTVRKRIENEMRLEIAWIVFATVIVLSLFLASLPATTSYFTEPEQYDEEILVIAYQYNFTFVRENGDRTVDVVYLRVNDVYKFNITSIDVIHSFYAHELSIKLDMVPGRYNIVYVQIREPGTYEIHCAEYCGFGHYLMQAKIIVE